MSLEQVIADLQTQAGLLLDLPQEIGDTALQHIAAIAASYENIVASQSTAFFVNQATGNDTASGQANAPLKTISKAVSLTPKGGSCTVFLQADYDMSAGGGVVVDQKLLLIRSGTAGTKHRLSFGEYLSNAYNPPLRLMKSFITVGNAHVAFDGLTVGWAPVIPGNAAYGKANTAMVAASTIPCHRLGLSIFNCDIDIPASPAFPLLAGTLTADLFWLSNTLVNAASYYGWLHGNYTAGAGTNPHTAGLLNTNLSLV